MGREGQATVPSQSAHAETRLRVCLGQSGNGYQESAGLPGARKHRAHGSLYRDVPYPLQGPLEIGWVPPPSAVTKPNPQPWRAHAERVPGLTQYATHIYLLLARVGPTVFRGWGGKLWFRESSNDPPCRAATILKGLEPQLSAEIFFDF